MFTWRRRRKRRRRGGGEGEEKGEEEKEEEEKEDADLEKDASGAELFSQCENLELEITRNVRKSIRKIILNVKSNQMFEELSH